MLIFVKSICEQNCIYNHLIFKYLKINEQEFV